MHLRNIACSHVWQGHSTRGRDLWAVGVSSSPSQSLFIPDILDTARQGVCLIGRWVAETACVMLEGRESKATPNSVSLMCAWGVSGANEVGCFCRSVNSVAWHFINMPKLLLIWGIRKGLNWIRWCCYFKGRRNYKLLGHGVRGPDADTMKQGGVLTGWQNGSWETSVLFSTTAIYTQIIRTTNLKLSVPLTKVEVRATLRQFSIRQINELQAGIDGALSPVLGWRINVKLIGVDTRSGAGSCSNEFLLTSVLKCPAVTYQG